MDPRVRLKEVNDELRNLRSSIETAKDEDLDSIETKINSLSAEKRNLEKRVKMLEEANDNASVEPEERGSNPEGASTRSMYTLGSSGETAEERASKERMQKRTKMGEAWKVNNRTVVLDNTVVVPKKQSSTLQGMPYNEISGILDAVNYLDVVNGETYEEPYVVSTGIGDYTSQPSSEGIGGEYHEVGIAWKSALINKTKITAYSEITKELEKTPIANYADAVERNISVALKKKLAKEMVDGDGTTGHFVGIMSEAADASTVSDFDLGVIGENTLDELILNYGGEEDIESTMSLLLNKLTLLAFSRVRGTDKRKVYNINYENNTIDGIKFFSSSHVKAFDSAESGDPVIAYGDFNKYRVAVFSNIETARSTEYKFRQGITAFRGDVFMGGNIIGYKAFTRVYKAATSITKLTPKTGI